MALIRNGRLATDEFTFVDGTAALPAAGPVLVRLERWQAETEALLARPAAVGVRLQSDQHPDAISADLDHLALVALEFPVFKDGRAYTYARLLRERHGYKGEIRAVGDVLLEQLHFMVRCGFDAFELRAEDPLGQWETAAREFSVWYQATGDGRKPARMLRQAP